MVSASEHYTQQAEADEQAAREWHDAALQATDSGERLRCWRKAEECLRTARRSYEHAQTADLAELEVARALEVLMAGGAVVEIEVEGSVVRLAA